jgi:hypothetical protein
MYRSIATQLSKELAGNNDTEEAKFVVDLANAVSYFATLGDKNVKLVDFSKGGFKILRFNDLVQKMRSVNLTVSYKDEKGRPEIGIHDVGNPKNTLISIRVKIENRDDGAQYVRNVIEKGPLLEKLTMEKQGKWSDPPASKTIARTQPVNTAPVAKPVPVSIPTKPKAPPVIEPQAVAKPDELAANDVDNTEYKYSAESVRPRRGLAETPRQRR